ncbi:MAG: serine/threonine-protein kinase, partial [Candidatus Acidiferrales bacterium]
MIGKTLGHYRIVEKIGAGGMGEVYRARDDRLERDVALKVLPAGTLADEASRQRFRKEALALARLNHPNIATVHDFNTQEGTDFLVMELVSGTSLSEKLAAGPLPEKEALRLGSQLAEGLAAAHEQNVVHRDLKPANLRVTPDGRLKILDFGLAKLFRPARDDAVTAEGLSHSQAGVAGTIPYMSPEQLRGEAVDLRTDIYAAGCVLYEMATGRRPFQETLSTALTDAILHKPAPPPGRLQPDLSSDLERIILKCLEKDPENRYQSAKELLVDLRRLAAPTAVPIAPSPVAPATGRIATLLRSAQRPL